MNSIRYAPQTGWPGTTSPSFTAVDPVERAVNVALDPFAETLTTEGSLDEKLKVGFSDGASTETKIFCVCETFSGEIGLGEMEQDKVLVVVSAEQAASL